jgi:hypothetical protein
VNLRQSCEFGLRSGKHTRSIETRLRKNAGGWTVLLGEERCQQVKRCDFTVLITDRMRLSLRDGALRESGEAFKVHGLPQ